MKTRSKHNTQKGNKSKKNASLIKGKTSSSTMWLRRQASDQFSRKAKEQGFVARSAFKLEQLLEKIPKKGIDVIVDLGSAPGGWTQISKNHFPNALIIGLDITPMQPIEGTIQIVSDFTEPEAKNLLVSHLNGKKIDLLLSDMSPKFSGISSVDHLRMMNLAEEAFNFGKEHLRVGAHAIFKVNRGGTEIEFKNELSKHFQKVEFVKPEASYKSSTEMYIIGFRFES